MSDARITVSRRVALLSAAVMACTRAIGQPAAWPQRPIRLIVPNAPASSVDTIARLVGNALAPVLQQAIVVDNRAGAAGALGVEAGRTGFEFSSWIGLMAPKGLPPAVAEALQRALQPVLQQSDLRKAFEPHGALPSRGTPQAFREFLQRDIVVNRRAIQLAGVQPE